MGKHHFLVNHQNKKYRCYLDEDDGSVYISDEKGNQLIRSIPDPLREIEDAKVAAIRLIESIDKD